MKIAVAVSSDYRKVSGHAGRARHWLVFRVEGETLAPDPERVELESERVFHYHEDQSPHPLDGIATVIATSSGDGFKRNMEKRGVEVALTAEADPFKAASDYLAHTLSAPKPRPIGSLICKTIDLFSKH